MSSTATNSLPASSLSIPPKWLTPAWNRWRTCWKLSAKVSTPLCCRSPCCSHGPSGTLWVGKNEVKSDLTPYLLDAVSRLRSWLATSFDLLVRKGSLSIWIPLVILGAFFLWRHGTLLYSALAPFLWAALLASILHPLRGRLSARFGLSRQTSAGITVLVLLVVGGSLLTLAGMRVASELIVMSRMIPTTAVDLVEGAAGYTSRLEPFWQSLPRSVQDRFTQGLQEAAQAAADTLGTSAQGALSFVTQIPALSATLVITLLALYFLLADGPMIFRAALTPLPLDQRWRVERGLRTVVREGVQFFRIQFGLMTVTAAFTSLVLSLAGVQYWLMLGLVVGILDAIPVIGPGLVLYPWSLAMLLTGKFGRAALLLTLNFSIFGLRQLLQARWVGVTLGIHPFYLLIAIYLGLRIIEPLGVFAGPLLLILARSAIATWSEGTREAGAEADPVDGGS